MPTIRILEDCKLAIEGLHVQNFEAGTEINVSDTDAECFVLNGFAEPVGEEKAKEEAPANKAKDAAPANKAKKPEG